MLDIGLTVKLFPVMLKTVMPAAVGVITTDVPEQMVALFTEILGVLFTETDAMAVFEARQPLVPVPVTE